MHPPDDHVESQAQKAGLTLALTNFTEDVQAAAASAANAAAALTPLRRPPRRTLAPMRAL